MKNVFFPEDNISEDDLFFVCYMIERIARGLKQPNCYVVNAIGKKHLEEKLSLANALHSDNHEAVAQQWIEEYGMKSGNFDITDVNKELVHYIPTPLQMGKVYARLILSTMTSGENYAEAIMRVYNNDICKIIDNYNSSAFYEPSYVITRAYFQGNFN